MAKQGMGKSMGNRECNWVRIRLPLWVDNGDDASQPESHGKGGDLSARERRQIERHLASCDTCCHYMAGLEHALGALAVAANQLPIPVDFPSLWPLLECRIASRHANADSRRPKTMYTLADQSPPPWGDLDEVCTLSQAWEQDGIAEALAGKDQRKPEPERIFGLIVKFSVAAAVLVALIGISAMRRQSKNPGASSLAISTPLADPVTPPPVVDESLPQLSERDNNDVPANQLAEAEPPHPVETPASAPDATAVPKSAPHTRFGFDLEHGTPMPPDSREAKPVY